MVRETGDLDQAAKISYYHHTIIGGAMTSEPWQGWSAEESDGEVGDAGTDVAAHPLCLSGSRAESALLGESWRLVDFIVPANFPLN